ncbi:Patatin-like phospholipase [Budvicia aquatica]|uniref:Patatin-like phospholipase n=1 Tax=Budvicia aquatica TaxID=82979 RepID=A0A484Z9U8_9GAMM|nr:Patatin-like phospholipase [Budvicia aquatica]
MGLVLSGGGAIGAYQVGVLKALHQVGAEVHMISGASIGALNGAILASAPSLADGVARLEAVWQTLAHTSPLQANVPVYLNYLLSTGLVLSGAKQFALLTQAMRSLFERLDLRVSALFHPLKDDGLFSEQPLSQLMDCYLDPEALTQGLPLYISVYETQGGVQDLLNCLLASIAIKDTAPSQFIHIQSLSVEARKEALLASAALPLLFSSRQVGEKNYSDGGIGGWQKMQGNTPITPLIDAGCDLVIVTHLANGSLWDRHDFPDTTVLEIRPQSSFSRSDSTFSGISDLLGFHPDKINSWIEQGYQDTLLCTEKIMQATQARAHLTESEQRLQSSQGQDEIADTALAAAMLRLK